MKNVFRINLSILVIIISINLLSGCILKKSHGAEEVLATETVTEPSTEFKEGRVSNAVKIDLDSVEGIGTDAAQQLCYDVFGDKDDGMTGFPISYRCIGAAKYNEKEYYVMFISWLVDNNHWSYIGNYFVAADGSEVYDGIVDENSNVYLVIDKIWDKSNN